MAFPNTFASQAGPIPLSQIDENFDAISNPRGSSIVGFLQYGTGAVSRQLESKIRELVSVKDFGAVGDGVTDDTVAIQAAFDAAFLAGGGTVLVGKSSGRYQISDTLTIRENTRVVFEEAVELTTASSTGTVLYITGDNIELINPLVNGGGNASDAGENGIGIVSGNNIQIRGGKVEECYRGGVGDMFGGKGVQIESGGVGGVLVDGLQFSDCFMAMSTVRDGTNTTPDAGILFTNIKASTCEILFFVKQSNINNTNGLEHTVQLNNFFALNCGAFEGVMQFSRAANVQVSNGMVINSNAVVTTPLIRGNHRFCRFDNIRFSGDCTSIISLDPSTFAVDSSYTCENNTYDINHSGNAGYVAYASLATTNRTLVDSKIVANLDSDVTTKISSDELRNGYCELFVTQGGRTIITTTAAFYLEGRSTVALYPAGISMPRFNSSQITFPTTQISSNDSNTLDDYEEGVWTPIDSSGAGLSFTTAYGDYTKIGRLVCASFTVTFPVTANASVVSIGALPFQAQNVGGRATGALAMRYTDQGSLMSGTINPGASTMSLAFGTGALVTNANMSGKSISGVVTYMAAT